jgi:hypothetical protein
MVLTLAPGTAPPITCEVLKGSTFGSSIKDHHICPMAAFIKYVKKDNENQEFIRSFPKHWQTKVLCTPRTDDSKSILRKSVN